MNSIKIGFWLVMTILSVGMPVLGEDSTSTQQADEVSEEAGILAIYRLEKTVKNCATEETCISGHLQLAQMKKAIEGPTAERKAFYKLAKNRTDYACTEDRSRCLSTGADYRWIIEHYSQSPDAEKAAFTLAQIVSPDLCGGIVACEIRKKFQPLLEFLKRYPTSKFAEEGVSLANNAFNEALETHHARFGVPLKDLTVKTLYYSPDDFKELLESYDELAKKLPRGPRARSYEVIGEFWRRLHDPAKAKERFEYITYSVPDYEGILRVQSKLKALEQDSRPLY